MIDIPPTINIDYFFYFAGGCLTVLISILIGVFSYTSKVINKIREDNARSHTRLDMQDVHYEKIFSMIQQERDRDQDVTNTRLKNLTTLLTDQSARIDRLGHRVSCPSHEKRYDE